MSACSETQRAIAQAISLSALDEVHTTHAAECPKCGTLLGRYRQLDQVTRRTRRVLETEGELSPNDWVRIREGIDRGIARRRPSLSTVLVGAAAAAAVLIGVAVLNGGNGEEVGRASALALDDVGAPTTRQVAIAVPAPTPEVFAASEGGVALTVAVGDVLKAGDEDRKIDAFGRHHVTIAARSEIRVLDWKAEKMALEVVAGAVTCDVNRTLDEDVFEVRSGDVTVRVLGTIFTVSRDAEGGTSVGVARGRVGVVEATGETRELSAGESATFGGPTAAQVDPDEDHVEPRAVRHSPTPRTQRVIQIDVPPQQMDIWASEGGWTSSRAYKAIVKAIDDGNCPGAMKALNAAVDASRGAIPAPEIAKLRARCK